MPYRLVLQLGDQTFRHLLQAGENLVGSDSSCEVPVDDPTVSRHHACLVCIGSGDREQIELADLGSRNGTWVDRQRVDGKVVLADGSAVRFGSVEGTVTAVAVGDAEVWADPAALDRPLAEHEPVGSMAAGAPSASTTASVGPLSLFTLGQLPLLVEAVADDLPVHVVAARAGEALRTSLPLVQLEIGREVGDHVVRWFSDADDAATARLEQEVEGRSLERTTVGTVVFQACFEDEQSSRLYGPVLETVARLLHLADRPRPGAVADEGDAGPATSPVSDARPPDPPTLESVVRTLYQRAGKVARGDVNVLIEGESGTGKELLARFLHAASPRSAGPFVALNCAALPRDLQETELFGIEQGVATGVEARAGKFELAHGGTLFLDEIGDMAPEVQAKILRVLQEGEVFRIGGSRGRPARARIVSATHRDIDELIRREEFRSDLLHRIADWRATVPPLRERRRDIPNLVWHFLARARDQDGSAEVTLSRAAMEALNRYDWPGNVRQLEREVLRARLFVGGDGMLDTSCLSDEVQEGGRDSDAEDQTTLKTELERFERQLLRRRLDSLGGDVAALGELLDVPSSTLYRKLKKHELI